MEQKTFKSRVGEFKISLYLSSNKELKKPWVFLVVGPEEQKEEGFARTRRGAERAVKKWIAKEEAATLLSTRQDRESERATRILEEAGLSDWQISRLQRVNELTCKQVRPGEVICLYKTEGIREDRWQAVLFLDGEDALSETSKTKRGAERAIRRGLQAVYQKEALRAIKPTLQD